MALSTNLTATGDISTVHSELIGFYVNSTTSGTIVLKSGGASGTFGAFPNPHIQNSLKVMYGFYG